MAKLAEIARKSANKNRNEQYIIKSNQIQIVCCIETKAKLQLELEILHDQICDYSTLYKFTEIGFLSKYRMKRRIMTGFCSRGAAFSLGIL